MVDVDDVRGSRLVVDHLVTLGHRRIAHIGGNEDMISAYNRRRGYLLAMESHGIEVDYRYVKHADYDGSVLATAAAESLLQLKRPPTAIFAGNDKIASASMKAAAKLGLRVPENLSIVGYDDSPLASYLNPPLTTVRQPLEAIGIKATKLVVSLINEEPLGVNIVYAIEPELIVRATSAQVTQNVC